MAQPSESVPIEPGDEINAAEARELSALIDRDDVAVAGGGPAAGTSRADIEEIYRGLRALAGFHMKGQRDDHTLQPTALAHEAWIRLQNSPAWDQLAGSPLLFRLANIVMRRFLISYARHKASQLEPTLTREPLDEAGLAAPVSELSAEDQAAIEEALSRLEARRPEACAVARLRLFCGLSTAEIAEILGICTKTVRKYLVLATAVLYRDLQGSDGAGEPRRSPGTRTSP